MYKIENNEISVQEVEVYRFLSTNPGWWITYEVAHLSGVKKRTAAKHLVRFVQIGLLDEMEMQPSHLYRWKVQPDNPAYVARLEMASDVLAGRGKVELENP